MSAALTRLRSSRPKGHRHLLTGSAVLVAGAGIQAASGAVFWLIAARLDTDDVVGSAGKLFTSVLFVTYLAGLGLPVALARYAADADEDSHVTFTWGVLATTLASLVLGIAYVVMLHGSATGILSDGHGILGPLLFALAVAGAALSMIVDVRCMTARRWNLVLARITVVGLVRLPLLFVGRDLPAESRELWLFTAAAAPVAISGLFGAIFAPRVAGGRLQLLPVPSKARIAVRYSAVNYLSTLAYQAPYFLLPVIVLANVPDDTYASFNVAWGIVAVAFYVPTALGQALLAEGGRDGAHVQHQLRLAMGLALGLMTIGSLAAWLGNDIITTIYGADYSEAARILPGMVAAGIPWAITSLYLSEVRIMHRHVATVVITGTLTAAIVVPALVLVTRHNIDVTLPGVTAAQIAEAGSLALDGAQTSWLIGNLVAAAVAMVAVRWGRAAAAPDPDLADEDVMEDVAEVGITLAEHTT